MAEQQLKLIAIQFERNRIFGPPVPVFDAIVTELPEEWVANEEDQTGNFDIDAMRRILNRYQLTEFWNVQP